jgi:hypothetical protein
MLATYQRCSLPLNFMLTNASRNSTKGIITTVMITRSTLDHKSGIFFYYVALESP